MLGFEMHVRGMRISHIEPLSTVRGWVGRTAVGSHVDQEDPRAAAGIVHGQRRVWAIADVMDG